MSNSPPVLASLSHSVLNCLTAGLELCLACSGLATGVSIVPAWRQVARFGVHADVQPVAGKCRTIGAQVKELPHLLAGFEHDGLRVLFVLEVLDGPAIDLLAKFYLRGTGWI